LYAPLSIDKNNCVGKECYINKFIDEKIQSFISHNVFSFAIPLLFFLVIQYLAINILKGDQFFTRKAVDESYKKFKSNDFNEAEFIEKVKIAAHELHNSFVTENIQTSRRFLSNGLFWRFKTNIEIRNISKKEQFYKNLHIGEILPFKYGKKESMETIDVLVQGNRSNSFNRQNSSLADDIPSENFTEIWSFSRKMNMREYVDIYSNHNCPSCSLPLVTELDNFFTCKHCLISNNYEFDWVLFDIMEADIEQFNLRYTVNLPKEINDWLNEINAIDSEFNLQFIKDRAYSAYCQLFLAQFYNHPEKIRHFVSDRLLEKLFNDLPTEQIIYLPVNFFGEGPVSINVKSDMIYLQYKIKTTPYKIKKKTKGKTGLILEDDLPNSLIEVIMSRNLHVKNKGSVFAGLCPSCGEKLNDSDESLCSLCNEITNSGKFDWVLDDIVLSEEIENT
jgi:hypothetical protein